jgi:predicted permease
MSSFVQDLRFALRLLAKSPGFTVIAVLTLAIGIGANTTVFNWIQNVLVRPLPGVPAQERVLVIDGHARNGDSRSLSVPDVRDIEREMEKTHGPLSVIAYQMSAANLTGGVRPERVWTSLVTGNFFDALQVRPVLGRGFRPDEDAAANAHPVTVLSHSFWKRRFLGDPAIVGKTIHLNGHPYTVAGVAPPGFLGAMPGLQMDLWVPMAMQEQIVSGGSRLEQRGFHWLQGLVRLRPGATEGQARAALDTLAVRLGKEYPGTNDGLTFHLYRFWNAPNGPAQLLVPLLTVLGAMAVLVLLLACANVANLLLVRALGRRKEVAIRIALGAQRRRLVAQLLTESLVLVILAGGLGLLLARWGDGLLMAAMPPADLPLATSMPVGSGVIAFAIGLSVLTGLLFSLAPAAQLSAPGIASTLRDEGGAVAGGRKGLLRNGLVVAQIFFSCVLLIAAGLFVRSLGRAARIDPGFSARNVLLAGIDVYPLGYDETRGAAFYTELLRRVAARPGVQAATLATLVPLDLDNWSTSLQVAGYQTAPQEEINVGFTIVGPDYLKTLGIPLLEGRDVSLRDQAKAPKVMVINQTMAKKYWPGRPALGGKVRMWDQDFTVVGIAHDGKYQKLSEAPQPYFYVPFLQAYQSRMVLHVRTAGDPLLLADAVRAEVQGLNPDVPLTAVKSMRQHLQLSVFNQRLAARFLGAFGLLALVLSSVGLYSVIRYTVSQRTREIGVRAALGAQPGHIARMIVDQGMRLAVLGLLVGLAAAFGVTRFLSSQLLGVSATDPLVFVAVSALLASVSAFASWLPARAAAAVDPNVALRRE